MFVKYKIADSFFFYRKNQTRGGEGEVGGGGGLGGGGGGGRGRVGGGGGTGGGGGGASERKVPSESFRLLFTRTASCQCHRWWRGGEGFGGRGGGGGEEEGHQRGRLLQNHSGCFSQGQPAVSVTGGGGVGRGSGGGGGEEEGRQRGRLLQNHSGCFFQGQPAVSVTVVPSSLKGESNHPRQMAWKCRRSTNIAIRMLIWLFYQYLCHQIFLEKKKRKRKRKKDLFYFIMNVLKQSTIVMWTLSTNHSCSLRLLIL